MTINTLLSNHQDIVQLAYFAIIIVSLWVCEVLFTADVARDKFKHTCVNLLFIFTALPIQLFMVSIVLMITVWTNLHH